MQILDQPTLGSVASFNFSAHLFEERANVAQIESMRRADVQFVQMLDGFRSSGGLARLQEVAKLCEQRKGPDIAELSACLAHREIICFEWQSHGWLPLFQFNQVDMRLHPHVQRVVSELSCIYDPWDLAYWFSQPNPWLAGRAPADALRLDPATVLQAARADRFVAN